MPAIRTIAYRKIINSHVDFTNEFIIELTNGSVGTGSTPLGETRSIYEDSFGQMSPDNIIARLMIQFGSNIDTDQIGFDQYLNRFVNLFGRNNCFALSLAFFNATSSFGQEKINTERSRSLPNICINVLNGGKYAYTNPVISDFPEFLIVSKTSEIQEIITDHNEIQSKISGNLATRRKTLVNGNLVNNLSSKDNRACLEFILGILEQLKLTNNYEIMIDASAGDLRIPGGYRFALTDKSTKGNDEFLQYWLDLINEYDVRYLEDPFSERDYESWKNITNMQNKCRIIGDNFYASDPVRIGEGIANKYTHGVIIKPDQAGTISLTMAAIKTALAGNQLLIASHRSISTESTFLSTLTNLWNIKYIKIGPLKTDYSSIVRLNELIRLSGIIL